MHDDSRHDEHALAYKQRSLAQAATNGAGLVKASLADGPFEWRGSRQPLVLRQGKSRSTDSSSAELEILGMPWLVVLAPTDMPVA